MKDEARAQHKPDGNVADVTATIPASGPKRVSSAELFRGGRELLIDHSGEIYRLRHTSQGKLLLTK